MPLSSNVQFLELQIPNFKKIICFDNPSTKVQGIIAIHNTLTGPALGGCRFCEYSTFSAGLRDAMSLAQAMTYKNAIMDLNFGGGKTVLFYDKSISKELYYDAFAFVLNQLHGEYLTTDDMGTSVAELAYLKQKTAYVRGELYNQVQIPATSYGVYQAMKATHYFYQKKNSLAGLKVIVQGLGKVGWDLCRYLFDEGCKLYVNDLQSDLVARAISKYGAQAIDLEKNGILSADIFSPCAVGGVLTPSFIQRLNVKYIVSGANNPLSSPEVAVSLSRKNTIYLPDYVCNAGGVLDIACEGEHYSEQYVLQKISKIYSKVLWILHKATLSEKLPVAIANQYVEDRLATKPTYEQVISA